MSCSGTPRHSYTQLEGAGDQTSNLLVTSQPHVRVGNTWFACRSRTSSLDRFSRQLSLRILKSKSALYECPWHQLKKSVFLNHTRCCTFYCIFNVMWSVHIWNPSWRTVSWSDAHYKYEFPFVHRPPHSTLHYNVTIAILPYTIMSKVTGGTSSGQAGRWEESEGIRREVSSALPYSSFLFTNTHTAFHCIPEDVRLPWRLERPTAT